MEFDLRSIYYLLTRSLGSIFSGLKKTRIVSIYLDGQVS